MDGAASARAERSGRRRRRRRRPHHGPVHGRWRGSFLLGQRDTDPNAFRNRLARDDRLTLEPGGDRRDVSARAVASTAHRREHDRANGRRRSRGDRCRRRDGDGRRPLVGQDQVAHGRRRCRRHARRRRRGGRLRLRASEQPAASVGGRPRGGRWEGALAVHPEHVGARRRRSDRLRRNGVRDAVGRDGSRRGG